MDYNSMDELFEKFLDEDYFGNKLEIFQEMKENMTRRMLDNIAASLDLILAGKSDEDDMEFIEYHLRTASKYETKRFGR
ncbi:MAG: hypothetical protein J6Z02_04300 [Lachnospiraceae bacterium]|nr:hypothetical protein [Lachnospiraceae bacterium]MBR6396523.1 hypothetical protein [Lachnospiraceae bacterium]MCR4777274.1 hypothetical protein [Lachnospiraceae bacterium]